LYSAGTFAAIKNWIGKIRECAPSAFGAGRGDPCFGAGSGIEKARNREEQGTGKCGELDGNAGELAGIRGKSREGNGARSGMARKGAGRTLGELRREGTAWRGEGMKNAVGRLGDDWVAGHSRG